MARVKRGPHRKEKRKKVLKQAKGYYGQKKNAYRVARQAVERALKFSYRDRRQKKRQFRRLWIVRINAAARENGLSYNRLISGLRRTGLELNRKVLAEIAVYDPDGFAAIVEVAKDALADEAGAKVRPAKERSKRPEPRTAPAPEKAAKPKKKAEPKKEAEPEKAEKPKAEAKPAPKAATKAEKAATAEKPEAKAEKAEAKAPAEEPTKADLEGMTVAELQELAGKHDVTEADLEGSGASGNVVKADWVRAAGGIDHLTVPELKNVAERRGISESDIEGTGANGNVVKADWVKALSE